MSGWGGGVGGPLPCHRIPRRASKVTRCLWRPACLTSPRSLKHHRNQIALSGPSPPSYFGRYVCGHLATHTHTHTHTHTRSTVLLSPRLLLPPLILLSNATLRFIPGLVSLMRAGRCQRGEPLIGSSRAVTVTTMPTTENSHTQKKTEREKGEQEDMLSACES